MNPNDQQKQAIEHKSGPLLIVAGAGTGKTTVLVEKVKYLIANNLAKPEEILCLTFTEKSAREMEERVDQALPYGYFQMWISTFHSFADDILREEISHIGLDPSYTLMTQAESILFLRKRLFLFDLKYFRPLGNPNKFIHSLLQHFSRLRDENISPEDYIGWAKKQFDKDEITEEEKEKNLELANAYKTYQDNKVKESKFDFADLIFYLDKLFRDRKSVLEKYKQQFKYVMVDEFQDTNIAQYELIQLLCPPKDNPNLTVVGDDSQAIYKFRGASISNILNFMKDYPISHQVNLQVNYRSNQTILDYSHKLIKFNDPDTLEAQLGISKKLTSVKKNNKEAVQLHVTEKVEQEADFIAKQILSDKKQRNINFSDFAILIRANNHAVPFVNALIQHGIPFQFLGPGTLFKQPEIKELIAYLKLLSNVDDSPSTFRVYSMNIFKLDQEDVAFLLAFARKTNLSLYKATVVCLSFYNSEWFEPEYEIYREHLPLIKEVSKTQLIKMIAMIKRHIELIKSESAGQILYYFLEDSGYIAQLLPAKSEKEEKIANNISKLFTKLKTLQNESEEFTVFDAVDYLDMSMEMGESPVTADTDVPLYNAVNILTTHGAKGLEFSTVFIVNLINGRFPTYEKKESIPIPIDLIKETLPQGNYHIQEERRLFYVGLTRAMDKVYMTASKYYGAGKRERKISPFVVETLGKEEIIKVQNFAKEAETQLSIFDFKKAETPVPQDQIQLTNFSYSQLASFETCPLQYKYQYLLRIPTPSTAAGSFGDTIHKTLQKFYQLFMNDPEVNLTTLLDLFEKTWIPLGYSSLPQQEKMKKNGRDMLTKYYTKFHLKEVSILGLEQLFKIKINNSIYISGKIDRVDSKTDGGIEIIDYKTGRMPDEKELKKSMQLSIYALAATSPTLYNKLIDKVTLTFYYLQDMEKISMTRTPEELSGVTTQIENSIATIRQNLFPPKVGIWCNFCPFKINCEAWQ